MNETCKVTGCTRPGTFARGWCGSHYKRWWRHGDPLAGRGQPLEVRLRERGWDVTETGCWEVRGSRHKSGYGKIEVSGKSTSTHRVAYELWVGPIPDGLIIRHRCDNPPCINPEHLEVGTHADNVKDMLERGRTNWNLGDSNPASKLTDQDVRDIRESDERTADLAQRYGVTPSYMSQIRHGKKRGGL